MMAFKNRGTKHRVKWITGTETGMWETNEQKTKEKEEWEDEIKIQRNYRQNPDNPAALTAFSQWLFKTSGFLWINMRNFTITFSYHLIKWFLLLTQI